MWISTQKASHWSEYTFTIPSIWPTHFFSFALHMDCDECVHLQRSVKVPLHADFTHHTHKKDDLITATYVPQNGSNSEKLSLQPETTTEDKWINNWRRGRVLSKLEQQKRSCQSASYLWRGSADRKPLISSPCRAPVFVRQRGNINGNI